MKLYELEIPKIMHIDKAIQTIDKNSEGALNLQRIRAALTQGNNDVLVMKTVDPRMLNGPSDVDVDSAYATPSKGPIFIDSENNVVDGRHRAALALQNNENIEAWVPANMQELVDAYNKSAP